MILEDPELKADLEMTARKLISSATKTYDEKVSLQEWQMFLNQQQKAKTL